MKTTKTRSWRDVIEVHPAADLFPMMAAEDLKALGEDIRQHGLHEPIAIDYGTTSGQHRYYLIDGRNRLEAMEMAGLAPQLQIKDKELKVKLTLVGCDEVDVAQPVVLFMPHDPIDYVVSKNIHRRHLTPEQRLRGSRRVHRGRDWQGYRCARPPTAAEGGTEGGQEG